MGWSWVAKQLKNSNKGKKKKEFKPVFARKQRIKNRKKDRIKTAFKQGILPVFGIVWKTIPGLNEWAFTFIAFYSKKV